jgi:hypothetical protein
MDAAPMGFPPLTAGCDYDHIQLRRQSQTQWARQNNAIPNCLILLLFVQCAIHVQTATAVPGGQKTLLFGIASFSLLADSNVLSR